MKQLLVLILAQSLTTNKLILKDTGPLVISNSSTMLATCKRINKYDKLEGCQLVKGRTLDNLINAFRDEINRKK